MSRQVERAERWASIWEGMKRRYRNTSPNGACWAGDMTRRAARRIARKNFKKSSEQVHA